MKNLFKEKNPRWIDGRSLKLYLCKDCGIKISVGSGLYGNGRCRACKSIQHSHEMTGSKSNFYIDGRKHRKYFCIDCKKSICYTTAKIGSGKCRPCSKIGNIHSIETKKKMSISAGGTGVLNIKPKYGPGFCNTLKNFIRNRDNFQCQLCGLSQEENGKGLDVHHKNYNKLDNSFNNLISLCTPCHTKTNSNRPLWLRRFSVKI